MKNNIERRLFIRIPLWFIVKYRLYPHVNKFSQGIARNISAGGICMATKDRLKKGRILDLEISLPPLARDIRVSGKIVWSCAQESTDQFIHGIEFKKIDPKDFKDIKETIETFTPSNTPA